MIEINNILLIIKQKSNRFFIFINRYQLLHSEELLKAFQALDTESKGHLTIDEAKNFFTRHGEAFAQVYKRLSA